MVSPFLGGASFELFLYNTYANIHVWGNDLFYPLYCFWNVLINREQQADLCTRLQAEHVDGINKEKFLIARSNVGTECEREREHEREDGTDRNQGEVVRAMNYFLVNRCSFSGSTLCGGYSEDSAKSRFTVSSIERIRDLQLSTQRFCMTNMDAFTLLTYLATKDSQGSQCEVDSMGMKWVCDFAPNNQIVLFLDPPYCMGKKQSRLYGKNGSLHAPFDHKRFFQLLSSIKNVPWILTYNDCDEVREMYHEYSILPLEWAYGMNQSKKSSEIVILSCKQETNS